jgi:hypothetical protein
VIVEHVDHRALAAIRFLDEETHLPVRVPLRVAGGGLKLIRNRRGLYVVLEAPGFEDYAASFLVPDSAPPLTTFTLTAEDPARMYLSRRFDLKLPRDATPGPDESLPASSLFRPQDVVLYASALARANAGSAIVRLTVRDEHGVPLPNALVELSLSTPALSRRGLSDGRGEALVLIPGIPIADWTDPTATTEFDLDVKAAWAPGEGPPDPDRLAASLQAVAGTIAVAAGQEVSRTIELSWVEQ